jgi:hypothetical protein
MSTPQGAIDQSTKYEVREYGENRAHHERFEWVNPALDDDLVDHIHNHRRDEDLANVLPGFAQEGSAIYGVFHHRPEIGRSAASRVRPPGANGKENCDERLNDQAESKRRMHAAGDVAPYAYKGVEKLVKHHSSAEGDEYLTSQ